MSETSHARFGVETDLENNIFQRVEDYHHHRTEAATRETSMCRGQTVRGREAMVLTGFACQRERSQEHKLFQVKIRRKEVGKTNKKTDCNTYTTS